MMIKSKLSERDICTKYITPAISGAGWNKNPHHFREEVYFTAGRIKVRDKLVNPFKVLAALQIHIPEKLLESHYAEQNPAVFGLPVRNRTQTGKREVILSLYLSGE